MLAPQVIVNTYVVNLPKYILCVFLSLVELNVLSSFCSFMLFHLKHVLKQILFALCYVESSTIYCLS